MKALRFVCALALFSFSMLQAFDVKDYEKFGDIYGNKTKNLMILEALAQEKTIQDICNAQHVTVAVPEFKGISHKDSLDILKVLGIGLEKRWTEIVSKIQDKDKLLAKTAKLPPEFINDLEKLANNIEKISVKFDEISLPDDITKLIEKASQQDWHLMVRSTGKEDSKELANAGGNESVANVNPDKESIIKALLIVVASYVKPKSINQRHDAGDPKLFENPFVPVLVQRMIGETYGGAAKPEDIPAGCVVYTEEQSGKLASIVSMNASFGHLEGVVNSSVGLDRFLVDENDKVFPVIKLKPTRLVPVAKETGKVGLERMDNPEDLITKASLDDEMIVAVATVCRAIQKVYGEPLDLEIPIDRKNKTIWLVQARPIQESTKRLEPSYIADIKAFNEANTIACTTVHPADAAVLHIENANQIITGRTLEDALHTYNDSQTARDNVKAIIVKGEAEMTSHAAAVFRGAGVAILTSDQTEKIKELAKQDKISLAIDIQQEKIIDLIAEGKEFQEIKLNPGYISFPVPLERTVIAPPAGKRKTCKTGGCF